MQSEERCFRLVTAGREYVRIVDRAVEGRSLVATRDFRPGDVVFEENPLVTFDDYSTEERFPIREIVDDYLRTVPFTTEGLSLAKTIRTFLNSTQEIREEWTTLFYDAGPSDSEFDKGCMGICKLIAEHFSSYGVDEHILARAVRVVALSGHRFRSTDVALFLAGSIVAHSCNPNMSYNCSSGKLIYRATQMITAGDLLTFRYIGENQLRMPTIIRREHLFQSKQFWCRCERCLQDDSTRAMSCPAATCLEGQIMPSLLRSEAGEPLWKCCACRRVYADDDDEVRSIRNENMLMKMITKN